MTTIKAIDGLPVIDAKKPLTIHVTVGDIAKADKKRPETCAAARAICREHHALEARVHLGRTYVRSNKGNWVRYATPQALRSEVIAFDRGGTFSPGEYVLRPTCPSERLGYKPKKKSTNTVTGKKRRRPIVVKDVRTGPA